MANHLRIQVYDRHQPVFADEFDGPIELGRQNDTRETAFTKCQTSGRWRAVIARLADDGISRRHALLELVAPGRIRLTNLSAKLPIRLPDGDVAPNGRREVVLPAQLSFGRQIEVRVEAVPIPSLELQGLTEETPPPGTVADVPSRLAALAAPGSGVGLEQVIHSLQAMMGVMQSAASSSDFFPKAARALVDHVGLNTGRVLLREDGAWRTEAFAAAAGVAAERDWQPSQKVLNRVVKEKRTFWQAPEQSTVETVSLVGVKAVVAAPVLDRHGEVIGALYGDRRYEPRTAFGPAITRVHAVLVDLLASAVAAGLARIEQEEAALAARIQFEQFFTPELSRQLAAQPDLLKGRECEVTTLFCDIRAFSRISERLGPAGTDEWIRDVMDALSEAVLAHRGVLVDYIGDEVMAMWGAPEAQPDHARLACQAGLDMLARLPALNARWQPVVGEPLGLAIGANTGRAQVGNTGSRRKFKYGPLGTTVNVASRVQGANKYLRTNFLVTGSTRAQLGDQFAARRLGKVAVVNIVEPVELYELAPPGEAAWEILRSGYEEALAAFESRDIPRAVRVLGNLLAQHPSDGPALVLLSRAVNALIEEPAEFDAVWRMPGK
jgi:adenylate cyclase